MRHRLLAVILTAALTAPALAQDAENQNTGIDIDFAGGTAAEYVETIRAAASNINIVTTPGLDKVPLLPIHLRNVGVHEALSVLESQHLSDHNTPAVEVGVIGSGVHMVRVIANPSRQESSAQLSVISVADVLESGVSADDLLSAVEAAMEMIGADSKEIELKFHQATGLILARGREQQVELIFDIVEQLRYATKHRNYQQEQALEREAAEAKLRDMELQMNANQAQRQEVERQAMHSVAELELLRKEHQATTAALAEHREALEQATRKIESLQAELARERDAKVANPD